MALADKSPVRQEHLKVRDIENTQSSSVLHQAVFTEKEKPGESFFLFLKRNYQEFICANCNSLHLSRPNIKC